MLGSSPVWVRFEIDNFLLAPLKILSNVRLTTEQNILHNDITHCVGMIDVIMIDDILFMRSLEF